MTKPIGVLTDSYPRYLLFLLESGLKPKQAIFVGGIDSVIGIELSGVVRVGNWHTRTDASELERMAMSRVR